MSAFPFVSIIIVNYNGAHFLPTCLDALRTQNYPAECFQVIVSDNASTDGSLKLLRDRYSWVEVLENQRNLGFASGNNVALAVARGQYIVLLNNDTLVLPDWLANLVAVAESHPRAGLVTARLQLFYDQLIVTLDCATVTPPNDGRVLGVQIFEVESGTPGGVTQYLDGCYGWENFRDQRFRWTQARARVGVPVPRGDGDWILRMRLAASRIGDAPVRVQIAGDGIAPTEWNIVGSAPTEFTLPMPATTRAFAKPLAQNTGSVFQRWGATRDRGTFVKDAQVFYEVDADQYNHIEEVFAGCGASLLLRREMLSQVGWFDDDFFMYYEDTDLAWRARLQGWQVLYAPQAIVRHIHCGTSQEWSAAFIYFVERNRLAMLFKNGTRCQVVATWSRFIAASARDLFLIGRALARRQRAPELTRRVSSHARALAQLFLWLPRLWRKRRAIQRARTVPFSEIERWYVN